MVMFQKNGKIFLSTSCAFKKMLYNLNRLVPSGTHQKERLPMASNIHEYMKLRQYFINLTIRANPENPLPSERTLAEQFGVARKTVRRALEDMVRDNYLIRRPRRGYFVNPLSMREDERRMKIIGLLHRTGMHALYNQEDACFMEAVFREIRKYNACAQLIVASSPEMIYNDIVNSKLDGLLWLGVSHAHVSVFERIHREGILPIAGQFDLEKPQCGNYVYMDHFREGYQKTKYLLDRGCRSILFLKTPGIERSHDGYSAALREAGVEFRPELLAEETISEQELAGLLKRFPVDGGALRFDQADRVRNFALAHGIRIPEDLQLITGYSYYDWNPTRTAKPFQTIISLLLEQLWNTIEHRKTSLQECSLDWEIIPGISTKEREKE